MEPPPFGSGNPPCGTYGSLHLPRFASMEPPPFGSGNSIDLRSRSKVSGRGFNGATAFRQWKLCTFASFNGATAFRQWKLEAPHLHHEPSNWLQWSHRLSAVETVTSLRSRGALCSGERLQWSHRLSAVETYRRTSPRSGWTTRFNGATAFRQWTQTLQTWAWTRRLQWSHRLSAVETSRWPTPESCMVRPIQAASMEPPPFGSGNEDLVEAFTGLRASMEPPPYLDTADVTVSLSFNGATAFRQWKLCHRCGQGGCPQWRQLQWSHRLSAVETYRSDWHRIP